MNYTKDNPLRVFTAFSGYDSQCLALNRLREKYPPFDYTCVGWSEIDEAAIIAHDALFPEDKGKNYGDISKIDWNKVPDFDLFTYSFPCGLAGTLVKTLAGYRKIEDLQVGDLVLTHKNRYRMVTKTMSRNAPSYFNIKGTGCHLRLTAEHPLFVLRDNETQWVKVKDLLLTDKLSYCIPGGCEDVDVSDNMLWILGRYVADGWVNPKHYHSTSFAIGMKKAKEFEAHYPDGICFSRYKKDCWEYRAASARLQELCLECGCGAKNKRVPQWVFELPAERLKIFLDGYFAGDGHVRYKGETKIQMFSTVSKELAMGIQLCLLKVYKKVCTLSVRHDHRSNNSDTYNGQIALTESPFQVVDEEREVHRVFVPIRSIDEVKGSVRVYNVSVEEDESYTCDNVNTHNCTDISAAGVQQGFSKGSGTRSSLLWECERAIEIKRPMFLLMENVKALVSNKFVDGFHEWLRLLESYGYSSFSEVLNAKDYGVPQNRERIFVVSVRDLSFRYFFPKPFKLDKCLADVLQENVDESFFLRDEMLSRFCVKSIENETNPL